MALKLNHHEQMLFSLLRASLHQKQTDNIQLFQSASESDWNLCYNLAARQGVLALAWDGVLTLPKELTPPKALRLQWGISVDRFEQKYERYCQTIAELSNFYASHGITTMQMKGVGLSVYYPIPSHREGGDIDIFTFSTDKGKMTDKEANLLADKLMQEQGIAVDTHSPKHSNFIYKGISIENHKTFLNVETYKVAIEVEALLKKVLKPQPTELLGGKYTILTPTPEFNTLFLAFHAAQHYASGLALHHLCDWAMLITRYGLNITEELKDKPFRNGIAALTLLCNQLLGTSAQMEGGERIAPQMLDEMLHPKYETKYTPAKGKWNILVYKTKRFLHRNKVSSTILYKPLWKHIWDSIVSHILHPETIFQTQR